MGFVYSPKQIGKEQNEARECEIRIFFEEAGPVEGAQTPQ